jgi:ketosteroid isomerase-like protein
MTNDTPTLEPLHDWFRTWEVCVRAVDFAAARALFAADVSGFGTHAAFVFGQASLERDQWANVWPKIADFQFNVDQLHGGITRDQAWAAVPWSSIGFDATGAEFSRPGRATVILRHDGGRWVGVHTHFSLNPGIPSQTFGRRA